MILTAAGLVLARAGKALDETLAEAERQLAAVTGRVQGPVAIGAGPGKMLQLAAETVGELARLRPDLEPRIMIETEAGPGLVVRTGRPRNTGDPDPGQPRPRCP